MSIFNKIIDSIRIFSKKNDHDPCVTCNFYDSTNFINIFSVTDKEGFCCFGKSRPISRDRNRCSIFN
jgi:hypothetical protein